MKLIALEEHMVTESVLQAPPGPDGPGLGMAPGDTGTRLIDLGERRLRDMDAEGVDVQVLSMTSPGVQDLAAALAIPLAREANDSIASMVASHPDRFEGLAALPTADPGAAVDELRRCVEQLGFKGSMLNGRTGSRNLDHQDFAEIFATSAQLGVPIYIHPQMPQAAVRDAYYSGSSDMLALLFAGPGLGWHYEAGIQLLRLILSGAFDRDPGLQVIVGHWGEVVLFYEERLKVLDGVSGLDRPIADYLRENVYYTPSGIYSQRYLRWTVELVGAERVMFSADYPYHHSDDGAARRFLEEAELGPDEKELIAHRNWQGLFSAANG